MKFTVLRIDEDKIKFVSSNGIQYDPVVVLSALIQFGGTLVVDPDVVPIKTELAALGAVADGIETIVGYQKRPDKIELEIKVNLEK